MCIISVEKQKGGNIMNFVELEKNLVDIVNQKTKECENQIAKLDKNARMEQKALLVQKAMYDNFLRIGLLYYTTGSRESAIVTFSKRLDSLLIDFPNVKELYSQLDEEDKKNITPFIHGMCFMKTQFFDMYNSQLEIASEKGDAKEIFELKVKANTTMEMLQLWQKWWNENGFIPCEVI